MQGSKEISSLQNPQVRKIINLKEKKKGRESSGLFVVEGQREIKMALKGRYKLTTVLVYPEIFSLEEALALMKNSNTKPEFITLTKDVYQRLAYREKTEGILAVAQAKSHDPRSLALPDKPLILVAEAPEKPGNLGALLRTADAANLDAVLIANPKSDLYNPNTIRSSVGCIFTVPVAMGKSEDIVQFLKEKQIRIFAATLEDAIPYTQADYSGGCAIAVGTEATGLTAGWVKNADQSVVIPMEGQIDSMNVSVSAAILIFEAKRQRLGQ
ncbi:TrmH family RNA methyltransferase [Muriicola soli]|uniref:RNA methyltransferase n=1 Tax=Muriicola soli TaxID=2507538 RepID=A0A411EA88_9FLAO|nr:RNA methyltransferase [Muriicola soli]QBA64589.1 RNA methyltransferase [Muriicola soli]